MGGMKHLMARYRCPEREMLKEVCWGYAPPGCDDSAIVATRDPIDVPTENTSSGVSGSTFEVEAIILAADVPLRSIK